MNIKYIYLHGLSGLFYHHFSVPGGRVCILTGANGIGKTALMHLICGTVNGDPMPFLDIPFTEFGIKFSDGYVFSVTRRKRACDIYLTIEIRERGDVTEYSHYPTDRSLYRFIFRKGNEDRENTVSLPTCSDIYGKCLYYSFPGPNPDYRRGSEDNRERIPRIKVDSEDNIDIGGILEKYFPFLDLEIRENAVVPTRRKGGGDDRPLLTGGERRIFEIFGIIMDAPSGSLVIMEHPETGLHPSVQRFLIDDIEKISDVREIDTFITTHSPVLIGHRWDITVNLRIPPYSVIFGTDTGEK